MTQEDMYWPFIYIILAALAVLFPEELYFYVEAAYIKIKIFCLNGQLLVRSYLIYRRLKADFERLQIPAPPFQFVPIQDRD